jgi:aryl-alcohol dehydrogenase-like predicted oxidoreductase
VEGRYWYGLDRIANPAGFGCWQLAGRYSVDGKPHGWSDISMGDAVRLVHRALDHGICFFDTAAAYGKGRSEQLLGQALASSALGAESIVCTKGALSAEEEEAALAGPHLVAEVEASLRRLRRSHIDILLLHGPPDDLDWRNFDRSGLDALVAAGKIITYGISSRSLAGAERVLDAAFGSCIEWTFNLLERRPARLVFPRLAAARTNFIARSPLARGLLTQEGASRDELGFAPADFRSTLPADWIGWSARSARQLLATDLLNGNLSETALRYCLSYEEVTAVIPGMHKPEQVERLVRAAQAGALEPEFLDRLTSAVEECYPLWA